MSSNILTHTNTHLSLHITNSGRLLGLTAVVLKISCKLFPHACCTVVLKCPILIFHTDYYVLCVIRKYL